MTVASLSSKDLVGIEPLTPGEITLLLDTAESMSAIGQRPIKKVPALRGRMVVNLFFEASTRTRFSFETAEKWLSADSLNFVASSRHFRRASPYSCLMRCVGKSAQLGHTDI